MCTMKKFAKICHGLNCIDIAVGHGELGKMFGIKLIGTLKKLTLKKIDKIKKKSQFIKAGEDIIQMLIAQKYNLINSWAVRFNYYCLKKSYIYFSKIFSDL